MIDPPKMPNFRGITDPRDKLIVHLVEVVTRHTSIIEMLVSMLEEREK